MTIDWRVKDPWRAKPVQHEHYEQKALFDYAFLVERRVPEWGLLFAIPNGGKRSKAAAGKLRAEGVKAGVPDIFLAVARGTYHGLFIELKAKGGSATQAQKLWMAALKAQGYAVALCFGWEAARTTIEEYLSL